MRVLELNKLYYPYIGGIEHVVQQLAEGLSDRFEMGVLACNVSRHSVREQLQGVKVTRVPALGMLGNLPIPFGLASTLRKMAKEQDVIHLHMPFPFGDLACLLSGYRGKIVVWWHSDIVRQKKLMHIYRPLMKWMLRRADVIIVATEGHIQGSQYLRPFRGKCVVIPYGVDKRLEEAADRYIKEATSTNLSDGIDKPDGTDRESLETQISSKKKKPLQFLFVGRLVYYKGCEILLRAFSLVKEAKLVLVGTGPMEAELRRLAKNLKVTDQVQFRGEATNEELYRQYAVCDVFVLPSIFKSEAFGLVQIEAMAFGKPVINTKLASGVPYVSLDGVTGKTVPPGDIDALAGAMQWMADHPVERNLMGIEARKRMKENYRLELMLQKVEGIFCGETRR